MKILSHGYVLLSNLLLIISIVATINAEYNEADYMSDLLQALKPTPIGWSNNTHHCKWEGISCNSTAQAVTSIILPSSSLTGTLPPNITTLTNLTYIDLHNNSLHGPLPVFDELDYLKTISLGHNKFSSVPDNCFQYIQDLRTLNLSNNLNLNNWDFPMDDLRNSVYLETLDLEATNMMGKLDSDTYFFFENLHTFFISHNKIRGNPLEYLAQSPIRYLQLNNNKFSGTISFISSMSNLSQAWLHNNGFKGRIPNMSNCTNLFDLQLQSNGLTSFVPSSLLNLSSLKIIFLDNNKLHGPIPVFRKSVVNATWESNNFCRSDVGPCDPQVMTLLEIFEAFEPIPIFTIKGNDACTGGQWTNYSIKYPLSLLIRCERGKIVTFKIRDFDHFLPGTISPAFSNLTSLVNLTLAGNYLNGSIPDSLKTLPQLQLLDVSNNNLSGVIPKFSPKVKLNVTGNAFLVPNMFRQVNPRVSSKANPRPVIWIAGQGGYGVVYKASLPDGRQVAVKVINESKGNGEEFINEVASISRTSHVNIVSLLGFCFENKRALIYEFMSNGSLDKFILKRGFPDAICSLDWNTMYQIAIGIARGLEYLHQGCISRILHLDIKPQNILLDENFCPKISDFGLAKICQRNDSVVSILGTRGTIGYIAPEVFSRTYGGVSHKSDVYSYGMLILEMIGGRKNYDTRGSCTSEMYFPDWIYKDLEQGNNPDHCIENSDEENDMVRQITMVSLWCIQMNPSDRPSMSKVLEMLQGPLQSVSYPPKSFLHSPEVSSLQTSYVSSNNLSNTN
ncbi:receptor kinase TMK4 [Trifolium repens]|nr:receptor kinase TMK4 [Trifolium repens]